MTLLTRIEIDGFKSFADFSLSVPPFMAILGPNASGKSNLFDAIQFLRRSAGTGLYAAFTEARGDMGELFRRKGNGSSVETMSFAAEVLLEPTVADQFGSIIEVTHTRIRYEVSIVLREDADGFQRPYVAQETAMPIRASVDDWVNDFKPSPNFRRAHLRYKRSSPLLETSEDELGNAIFKLAQEGRQGRKREIAAHAAEATVLSSMTTAAEFPLLYALRKELESWRFMQLDPQALRLPSTQQQRSDQLEPNGANLAKVLRRIEQRTEGEQGSSLDEIAADLASVIRGLSGLEVEENKSKEQFEVYITTRDEGRMSARVASDGTLRVLALLAALHDPQFRGLICFEEPENGIYPQRLRDLIALLRGLVTHPATWTDEEADQPLSQLVISSHSPILFLVLERAHLSIIDWVGRLEATAMPLSRVTRVRSLRAPGQEALPQELVGSVVSDAERKAYAAISESEARRLLED